MQMHTDDEIYAVDDIFLGPPRASFPFRVRYRAYLIGAALFALILVLEIWTGVIGPWNAVYGLLATIWLTMQVMERVDHEHTAKAVFASFAHEVAAPAARPAPPAAAACPWPAYVTAHAAPADPPAPAYPPGPRPGPRLPNTAQGEPVKKKTKEQRGLLARLLTTSRPTTDAAYRSGLQLSDVVGNLAVSRSGTVTAWYVAGPQRWSFLSDADRNQLLLAHAQRLAELNGRRIHLRITHRPYPVARWARALDDSVINPLPGWDRYLEEEQRKVGRLPLDDKVVYYGVTVGRLSGLGRSTHRWFAASQREVDALGRDLQTITATMRSAGMTASPADPDDMHWLLTRSLGLGLPAPLDVPPQPDDQWYPEDLAEFTEAAEWSSPEPYTPHIVVTGTRQEPVTRYVSVLSVGRMSLSPIPESGASPWLQRLDRLPFPYEVSATFDVREGDVVNKEMRDQLDRIHHQVRHHQEHGVDIPHQLARQRQQGLDTEDEVKSAGFAGVSTRTHGWVRIAVAGTTPEQTHDRVSRVQQLYKGQMLIHRPADQYKLAREFIPCEPIANDAYKRRLPVTTLAGALPAASALVGDRIGPNLGYTSGASRRAVMWHPWRSTEVAERSGLTLVVSTLGGGKSTLGGKFAYDSTRMGAPVTVLDPSGPMTRLCTLPELRPFAREIDLMGAEPGTLNPYRVIPDPRPDHFEPEQYRDKPDPVHAADTAYRTAQQSARAQRRTLAVDVLRGLLDHSLRSSEATNKALLMASQRADTSIHSSPYAIIDVLEKLDGSLAEHGKHLAELLRGAAELPQGQLIFPAVDAGDDHYLTAHHRLVVMSLKGLNLPTAGVPASEWTLDEQYSMPLLYLAGWYAQRSIYDRPMHERKGLLMDEAWALLNVSSGRALVKKTGRDSRKHNARAVVISQDAGELMAADLGNWIDSVFIGRTTGEEAQRAALRLIGIAPGNGYERVLEGLSAPRRSTGTTMQADYIDREFIFSDGNGGIERITVDLRHRPSLFRALNTTAAPLSQRTGTNPWTDTAVQGLVQQNGGARR
ncbi:ATP-binding protein [Streptomyces sp. Ac-502]|uniref:ATP-binding protein n=1 Tax=Streptomyces sp. Ac-502 TaxID=3342801 RepID=UPI0038622131